MTTNKTAKIQFYEGTDEPVVPEIRLTRSKDGTTGHALFLFEKPQGLSSITDGEITGMRMIDSEGEILTREVKVKFVDGEPIFLEHLKEFNFSAIIFSNCSFEGCFFIPKPPNVLPL